MVGYMFTWERSRGSMYWVEEKLDRALENGWWFSIFPRASVLNEDAYVSDHIALILHLGLTKKRNT